MGRLEKQLNPHAGPSARFASELRELRRTAGSPTYREMSKAAGYSPSALSAAASGANLPSVGVLSAYVKACGGDVGTWLAKRTEANIAMTAPASAAARAPRGELLPRRFSWRQRIGGLAAAALVGSLATVVPMAIWGAPACLTQDGGHPVPAATASCPAAGNR